MSTHKHTSVNPLTNPVRMGDVIIAASGEKWTVMQNMRGDFRLELQTSRSERYKSTNYVPGQIGICAQIDALANF